MFETPKDREERDSTVLGEAQVTYSNYESSMSRNRAKTVQKDYPNIIDQVPNHWLSSDPSMVGTWTR
jgi:hypothetical protein